MDTTENLEKNLSKYPFVQAGLNWRKRRFLETAFVEDPLHVLLDNDGVRYHLLLTLNEHRPDCKENQCLRKLYKSQAAEQDGEDERNDCYDLFWRLIANHAWTFQTEAGNLVKVLDEKPLVRIQVFTNEDGKLCAKEHNENFETHSLQPVMNPCESVTVFPRSEVDRLEDLDWNIYKARIRGAFYCIKTVFRAPEESSFLREIETLAKARRISNVVPIFGVVEADSNDGKIDGIVLRYITDGVPLSKITFATLEQKKKWQQQIADAVKALHEAEVIWGDAKAGNVLIDGETNNAFLVDFGGGTTKGWVDMELSDTEAGDNQGISRILKHVDSLPTSE